MAKVNAIRCPIVEVEASKTKPLKRTRPKPYGDTSYRHRKRWVDFMAWIKTLPCVVCGAGPPCDAAHTGEKAGYRKPDDRTCIPLCKAHHQLGKDSHHRLTAPGAFWERHGIQRFELYAELNEAYAAIDKRFIPLKLP